MKIKSNERLSEYTTVRIGGLVEKMYIPESPDELLNLLCTEKIKYFIGGGSNILISDLHTFDEVVNLREFDKNIKALGKGRFKVGASARLQTLINYINESGYGGIEYLFSVPGLVGGAILMNAGGSVTQGNAISDYIISVDALVDGKIVTFQKSECNFSYRNSIFKLHGYIVLSAIFEFPEQDITISKEKIKARISFSKKEHDYSGNNFGSVFCVFDPRLMTIVKKLSPMRKSKGVYYSHKTLNWIVNYGDGKYSEAIKNIKLVIHIHHLFFKKCLPEVIIWK